MARTRKEFSVRARTIDEVKERSKNILMGQGFRVREVSAQKHICTRGLGLLTAQQRCILEFGSSPDGSIKVTGEFFTLACWFLESTVAVDAIGAAIPRRKGYTLMMDYLNGMQDGASAADGNR